MSGRASLNHIYRTIWNPALGAMVAVAEIASSGGKSGGARSRAALAGVLARDGAPDSQPPSALRDLALSIGLGFLTVLTFASGAAHAQTLPIGGVAVQGAAKFDTSQTNKLTVTTTNGVNSGHSAINWNSFSIGAGNTVNFVQPNAASLSINRVVTNTPSQLFGTLSSNGQLVLVNQSGIAVGAGAVVDTAGFTASAVGMSQADAVVGRLRFSNDSLTNSGNSGPTGVLTVQGNIIARGGDVVLIAPSVDLAKTAVVESQGGSVSLVAGQSVELTGRGLEGITLQMQAPTDQAINLGTLKGDAVGIFAGTLRHSGMIQAVQANLEGGKVVLKAVGDAYVEGAGRIVATGGVGTVGGQVDVLGDRVAIAGTSLIDVSGQTGGGSIRIGGDFQGKNAAIQNASKTYLGPDATLKADAIDSGNGGRVIVWADQQTQGYGNISAQGGAKGGDGGFVEVSGKHKLAFSATVNTLASKGKAGTLLLDPDFIDVSIGGTTGLTNVDQFADPGANAVISPGTINAAATNVVLQANEDITFNSPVSMINPGVGLTAQAGGFLNVAVGSGITTKGGAVTLIAGDPGSLTSPSEGALYVQAPIDTTGGGAFPAGAAVSLVSNTSDVGGNTLQLLANVKAGTNGNVNLQANSISLEQFSGVITGRDLFATANNGIVLSQSNNLTGTVHLAAAGDTISFNNVSSTNLINATAVGNILITSGGVLNSTGPITSSAGSISLSAPSGISLSGNVQAATSLNMTTSAGGGSVTQSAGAITVGGATVVNAGSGNISLSQVTNDFNTISVSGSSLLVEDVNALTVSGFSYSPTGNVYFQARTGLVLPAGPITTTGSISLSDVNGPALTTPGALTGSSIQLISGDGINIAHNLTSTGNLQLITNGTSGQITQLGGTVISAPGLTTATANSGTSDIFLDQPGNNFGTVVLTGGSAFLRDINSLILGNANVSGLGIINSGNVTQQSGTTIVGSPNVNIVSGSGSVTLANPGNDFSSFSGTSTGAVSLVNSASPGVTVNLFGINVGSFNLTSPGAIHSCCSTIVTTSGGFNLQSTAGQISLNTDSATNVNSAAGIKIDAASHVTLTGSALTAASGSNIEISSASGSLFAGGATANVSGGGRWLTYLPSAVGNVYGPFDPLTANFRQVNAPVGSSPLGTGTGSLFAAPTLLTSSLSGAVTKVFDGGLPIDLAGAVLDAPPAALFGELGSTLTGPGGVLDTPNAGTGKNVSITNFPITLFDALARPTFGYTVTASGAIGTVTPASVSIIGLSGTRPYDGTPTINASVLTGFSGLVGTDTLTLSGAGSVANKNIGVNKPVSLDTLALGDGTGLAINYTLLGGTHVATITPATISSFTGITASNKVYNGTTGAAVVTSGASGVGVFSGDVVGVGSATGSFGDKSAAFGKFVTISGISLSGLDAGNYVYSGTPVSTLADITPASITAVSGVTAANRVYDGTTAATVSTAGAALTGLIGGDSLALTGGVGAFSDKNVGPGKSVLIVGLGLGGTDAGNYTLASPTAFATASISQATIGGVTGITASNKVYDGNTSATLSTASAVLSGLVGGDSVSVLGATGTFSDKNAGSAKTVSVAGLSLGGTDGGNYVLGSATATTVADITKATISSVSGIGANNKVYDATTAATLNTASASLVGAVSGDAVGVTGTGAFTDKNAGFGKTVNVTGINLAGPSAGNYIYSGPTTATASADISKANLGALTGVTASNKVYDGTTAATLTGATTVPAGVFAGDAVTVVGITGSFADRNVGVGKTVAITGGTLSGADAGNYTLAGSTASGSANIIARPLAVWTGLGSGLWSDAANWDALPDGSNVLAVSIPSGAGSVTFDAAVGSLTLPAFTSLRPVIVSGGDLSFGGNLNLANFSQTGGTVIGAGRLNVTDSFNQSGGSMVFGGAVTANQTVGNLVVGNLNAPSVSLRALSGSITQTGALTTPALITESANGTSLTRSENAIGSFKATNTGTGGITLANNRPLDVVATRSVDGNIIITNVGKVDLVGLVNAPNGSVSVTANSPLRVGPEGISAGGDVTLVATNLTSAGDIVIDGPIVSGGGVTMLAANTLTQNSVIFGANGVRASAAGGFTYGPLAVSGRSPVVYSSGGVAVRAPLSGAEAKAEGVLTQDSIVTFLDLLGRAQRRQLDDSISTNSDGTLNRKKDREGIVAEGEICRP